MQAVSIYSGDRDQRRDEETEMANSTQRKLRFQLKKPILWLAVSFISLAQILFIVYSKSPGKFSIYRNESYQNWNSFLDTKEISSEAFTLDPTPKKILIWNTYWESKSLWNKIFKEILDGKCPISNCVFTINHSEVNTSDAVLVHLVDLHGKYTVPTYRRPDQIWIGMTYEPPFILSHTGLHLSRINGIFNRTMSYRQDSDIPVQHGTFLKYGAPNTEDKLPTRYVSNWIHSREDIQFRNYALGKRRLVAWFASSRSCKSQSGREHYVRELQEFIDVDVYGSCGPFKCGVQKTLRNPYQVEHDDCYFLVSSAYKFVLAFENSICEDYVTEKLYNNLKLNVVPVVFGGANYSHFAPPHSVIQATDYTPDQLAKYLVMLDKNDTLYNEYFAWKKDYFIESYDGVPMACALCEKLHNSTWTQETKVYDHFDTWLTDKCQDGYGFTTTTTN